MKPERKFTYLKKSETKDERVFNGDDPKENKAFFTALKADEKERIESSKQSIDYFENTLFKYSEILACEVKTKNEAKELKALVFDRFKALQVFKGKDEFTERYNELIQFTETMLSQIDSMISNLPDEKEPFDKTNNNSNYSALQWGAIFYYAKITKLLPKSDTITGQLTAFIKKHNIGKTFKHVRVQYYEAKKRINDKNDYPIDKLESIIPFLQENYKQTVTKVLNDLEYLKDNLSDY